MSIAFFALILSLVGFVTGSAALGISLRLRQSTERAIHDASLATIELIRKLQEVPTEP